MSGDERDTPGDPFGEPLRRLPDGTYSNNLDPQILELISSLGSELAGTLEGDDAGLRRLFPTAYPDDPEREAGYQILSRQDLIDQRRAAVEVTRTTIQNSSFTESELSAWLAVTNDLRLVLGTRLDVSEEDDFNPEGPDAHALAVYHLLGSVAWVMVDALSTGLPETPADE